MNWPCLAPFFGEWETTVAQEVGFMVVDLACKICTIFFSYAVGNSQTGIETGLYAIRIVAEPVSKLHILGASS